MTLIATTYASDIVPGTYFWHNNSDMQSSKSSSSRPMLVVDVVDGIAYACPTSGSSDAWVEKNEVHCLPVELNPRMLGGKDSFLAVNKVLDNKGWFMIPVEQIQGRPQIVLPSEFVEMTKQLLAKWTQDRQSVRRRWNAPLSKSIQKRAVKRVAITMYDIMDEHFPCS